MGRRTLTGANRHRHHPGRAWCRGGPLQELTAGTLNRSAVGFWEPLASQFGIPRVVIGDVVNASSDETIRFMRSRGIEVVVMDPKTSAAARDCVDLVARFRREKPQEWLEDWGGGPNPKLVRATG